MLNIHVGLVPSISDNTGLKNSRSSFLKEKLHLLKKNNIVRVAVIITTANTGMVLIMCPVLSISQV